jgi:hypothetical protein
MPVYTLVVTGADGQQHTALTEFGDDTMAVRDTGYAVTAEHPSIAVGRGSGVAVDFLGVWEWAPDGPRWTPEDS